MATTKTTAKKPAAKKTVKTTAKKAPAKKATAKKPAAKKSTTKKRIDWGNLPFGYMQTTKSYVANWKNGKWARELSSSMSASVACISCRRDRGICMMTTRSWS